MTKWIRHWWPTILMMALIFIASGTSGRSLPRFGRWDAFVKKGGHLTGYALLAVALLHGLAERKTGILPDARRCSQCYWLPSMPSRTNFIRDSPPVAVPRSTDVAIDTLGATIGLLVWARLRRASASRGSPARRGAAAVTGWAVTRRRIRRLRSANRIPAPLLLKQSAPVSPQVVLAEFVAARKSFGGQNACHETVAARVDNRRVEPPVDQHQQVDFVQKLPRGQVRRRRCSLRS